MLLTSKLLDSKVAVLPSYTFIEFIIRQEGHQLRKHRLSKVHKLVYEQFLGNSNRKNYFRSQSLCLLGTTRIEKKLKGQYCPKLNAVKLVSVELFDGDLQFCEPEY